MQLCGWGDWLGVKNTLLEILYLLNVILIKQTDMKQYNNIDLSEIHSCGVDGFAENYIKCKKKKKFFKIERKNKKAARHIFYPLIDILVYSTHFL